MSDYDFARRIDSPDGEAPTEPKEPEPDATGTFQYGADMREPLQGWVVWHTWGICVNLAHVLG